jgi:hypothetical protein
MRISLVLSVIFGLLTAHAEIRIKTRFWDPEYSGLKRKRRIVRCVIRLRFLKLRISSVLKPDATAKDRWYTLQPLIGVRLMRIVWLAERRLIAHNPSLARQASVDAN